MLFACLLIGGPITGAHFNPAVTVGVWISDMKYLDQASMGLVMIFGQIIGAIWGTILVWFSLMNFSGPDHYDKTGAQALITSKEAVPTSEILLLLPSEPYVTVGNAFQIEMICTFVFVMINLIVKTGKTSPTNDGFLSCLAVAFTLLAMICIAGSKTGGCLNPAVGIAQTLFGMYMYGDEIPNNTQFKNKKFGYFLWLYICAPLTGAIFAGLAHRGHLKVYELIANNGSRVRASVKVIKSKLIE